jgi:hypothetical protein
VQIDVASSPLHLLANLVDPFDYSTHENQLILAKQLIERGTKVNKKLKKSAARLSTL